MNKFYMGIECQCPLCGATANIYVKTTDYRVWRAGALVQTAFPYLKAWMREMLISGLCPTCYDSLMGEDEEGE